jgi:hypothetical protein
VPAVEHYRALSAAGLEQPLRLPGAGMPQTEER